MDQDIQIASQHAQHSVPDQSQNEAPTAMQVDTDNVKKVIGFMSLGALEQGDWVICMYLLSLLL